MKENNNKIIYQILNELKYNKRLIPIWQSFMLNDSGDLVECLRKKIDGIKREIKSVKSLKSSGLDYLLLLKKVTNDLDNTGLDKIKIINFDKGKKLDYSKIEYNYFSKLDLNSIVIGAIWLDVVAPILESEIYNEAYANRLSGKSTSFFELYFTAYSNYRDSAFSKVDEMIENKEEGLLIQLDITRCFYHVNIEYLYYKVNKLIENYEFDKEEDRIYSNNINEIVFSYIRNYSIPDKSHLPGTMLPIGFFPSNVLINYYLFELDNLIIDEFNPISYGRYVDDITIVLKRKISNEQLNNDINKVYERLEKDILKRFNEKVNSLSEKDTVNISYNEKKVIFFPITESIDKNLVKTFKRKTEYLSSDFNRLIDISELEEELSKAYDLINNPTKLEEMFLVTRNKKQLTKMIATVFHTLFSEPFRNENQNKILAKNFMKILKEVIDDEMFVELYDYWIALIFIELAIYIDVKYIYISLLKDGKISFKNFATEILVLPKSPEIKNFINGLYIVEKINSYKNTSDEFNEFINLYLNVIKLLTEENLNCYYAQLLLNFIFPKYFNPLYEKRFLLHEKQLSNLNIALLHCKRTSEEKFIDMINLDIDCDDNWVVETDKTFKNIYRVGQVNLYSGEKKIDLFKRSSVNYDDTSDIIKIINEASCLDLDFVIFPEQGISLYNIYKIAKFVKNKQIAVIAGLDYLVYGDFVFNFTVVLKPVKVRGKFDKDKIYNDCHILFFPKQFPAPLEYEMFHYTTSQEGREKQRKIYLPNVTESVKLSIPFFEFKNTKHCILNCYEATDLRLKAACLEKEPDFIHIITHNKDVNYYNSIGETLSRETMSIVTITNYSIYGGTQIFIPFREKHNQLISYHKGSDNIHVYTSNINVSMMKNKRYDNTISVYRQNPPSIYYGNILGISQFRGGETNDNE